MKTGLRFWLITLLACASVLTTFALGQWQLARAAQKLALQAAIARTTVLPPVDEPGLVNARETQALLHRTAHLRGTWLGEHTVYLDNRQMRGRAGLYVLTPLKLQGSSKVVVVQRGWVARNFLDREQVPALRTPQGVVELVGRLAPPPSGLYALGQAQNTRIRQNLDMVGFAAELGHPLLPLTLVQTGPASEGLLRDWPVVSGSVEKHHGYAFQWFALSALIASLYVWFQIVRPKLKLKLTSQRKS